MTGKRKTGSGERGTGKREWGTSTGKENMKNGDQTENKKGSC